MRVAAVLTLIGLLGAIYVITIRPKLLHWGATRAEINEALPGDSIVDRPAFDATRAITIRGRPEDVWPWLVQMGYKRAGFYGYDLIEGLGNGGDLRSARAILPEFQNPHPGDLLPISAVATLRFGSIAPNRYVVWEGLQTPPDGVFIWALVPLDAGHTRLISRIRWRYLHSASGITLGAFTEFADHVAVRAILRGIRDRVEGRPPLSLWLQAFEMAGWTLALLELATGLAFILRRTNWKRAWLLALGAGLLAEVVLYGPAPAWLNGLLPWAYLALMEWDRRRNRAIERAA